MRLILRPYAPADFDTLYEIDQACYAPGIAYSRATLRAFLRPPSSHCLVAERQGEIAGFIVAEQEGQHAHLITLDVLEAHRRRGVGSALLEALEAELASRGARQIELETAVNNEAAVAFWRKHGYRTRGVYKRYYLGRMDALAMTKGLGAPKES